MDKAYSLGLMVIMRGGYYMNGIFVPNICHGMGLTKGSEPFGNCVVSLINEIIEDD